MPRRTPGGGPSGQVDEADRHTRAVKLRLTPERAARLRALAAERRTTVSGLVSELLDECGPADPDEG